MLLMSARNHRERRFIFKKLPNFRHCRLWEGEKSENDEVARRSGGSGMKGIIFHEKRNHKIERPT